MIQRKALPALLLVLAALGGCPDPQKAAEGPDTGQPGTGSEHNGGENSGAEEGGGEEGGRQGYGDFPQGAPLTADIAFTFTGNNSSGLSPELRWEGMGTERQSWAFSAREQRRVYFAVNKEAAQTVVISGRDRAKVTQTIEAGRNVDGSTASAELTIFSVNIEDLYFAGGTRNFALEVVEAGKAPLTVSVTLTVTPNLDAGITVFRVTGDPAPEQPGDESLELVSGINAFNMPGMAFDPAMPAYRLLDALAWIDRNAEEGGDYLVRVEKNEELPAMALTCLNRNVTIRLRGYGAQRIITHDESKNNDTSVGTYRNKALLPSASATDFRGFLNVGDYTATRGNIIPDPLSSITLILEEKITLQGRGTVNRDAHTYLCMVQVRPGSELVMRNGSMITGYAVSAETSAAETSVIYMANGTVLPSGRFRMTGGEISGNTVGVNSGAVIYFESSLGTNKNSALDGSFEKTGGSITGNYDSEGEAADRVYFRTRDNAISVEPGRAYSAPPIL
ncbi:MAG: hypothetical protein LBQ35_06710 [Spirochaetaceae bacterium]|jgi:hypothetical protein|nr:hypothetical protein [Spirochaetaceae bacterium]